MAVLLFSFCFIFVSSGALAFEFVPLQEEDIAGETRRRALGADAVYAAEGGKLAAALQIALHAVGETRGENVAMAARRASARVRANDEAGL